MSLTEVFVFVTIFMALYHLLQRSRSSKGHQLPPSFPSLPVVGSIPFIRDFDRLPEFFMRKAKDLGPVFGFYVGSKFCLVINGREAVRYALLKKAASFADSLETYVEKEYTNKNNGGLIFKKFDDKFKHYRLLTFSVLRDFGLGVKSTMERKISEELSVLLKRLEATNCQPFYPAESLKESFASIISGFLFDSRFDDPEARKMSQRLNKCVEVYQGCFEASLVIAPIMRFTPYYAKRIKVGIESHSQMMDILQKQLDNHKAISDSESPDSFIKQYVSREGPGFDREQLLFTLRDVFIGGSDTMTNTVFWGLILLANYPDVQDRVQREIDAVVPRDAFPSAIDKSKFQYMEAVILETMRIRTLFPFSAPHATVTDTELNGYFIPANALVLPNLYSVHMDPDFWGDPTVFRPERFLDPEHGSTARTHLVPFSLGKRACPGEVMARHEVFAFLSAVAQRYHIRPPDGLDRVDDTPEPIKGLVKPSPGVQLRFIARQL